MNSSSNNIHICIYIFKQYFRYYNYSCIQDDAIKKLYLHIFQFEQTH